ncbi:MAG: hypothetical protein IRZ16_20100 [Myxococcaceae bacterium]|nr:hypothetical protein [Myxococcaceae bacterium]
MAHEPRLPPRRRRWVNLTIIAVVVALPIAMFVLLQVMAAYTRSGTIDEVWFADTDRGPRIIGRDQVVTGTEARPTVRNRLVLVDARRGERIAREHVPVPMRFLDVQGGALWFAPRHGTGNIEARDPDTLRLLPNASREPSRVEPSPAVDPLVPVVDLGGRRLDASAGAFTSAGFLRDQVTGAPIVLDGKAALVIHRPPEDPQSTLLVSRVESDLKPVWTARLERQRAVRAAHVVDGAVVIVTSGAARDFAIAVDLSSGRTRWVHYF